MMTIYLGVLAVGIIAILIILINEKRGGSRSSAVDLLNSLDVDETPTEDQASSAFLRRLNLEEEKNRKAHEAAKIPSPPTEELPKEIKPEKESLDKTTSDTTKLPDQI